MGYTIAMLMIHRLTIQIQTVLLLGDWDDRVCMWLSLIGCNDRVIYLPFVVKETVGWVTYMQTEYTGPLDTQISARCW